MTFRLIYTSRNMMQGHPEQIERGIASILDISRRNNRSAGVGGVLMFNNGCFLQVLEGPLDTVTSTFERIQCDRRHADVIVLEAGDVADRLFTDWSMAFVGSNVADLARYRELSLNRVSSEILQGGGVLGMLHELVQADENRAAA